MTTKLTLTIDEKVIEKAKHFAKKEGKSISSLVENYLKLISSQKEIEQSHLSPIVQQLKGSFKEVEEIDYKEDLILQLAKKYVK